MIISDWIWISPETVSAPTRAQDLLALDRVIASRHTSIETLRNTRNAINRRLSNAGERVLRRTHSDTELAQARAEVHPAVYGPIRRTQTPPPSYRSTGPAISREHRSEVIADLFHWLRDFIPYSADQEASGVPDQFRSPFRTVPPEIHMADGSTSAGGSNFATPGGDPPEDPPQAIHLDRDVINNVYAMPTWPMDENEAKGWNESESLVFDLSRTAQQQPDLVRVFLERARLPGAPPALLVDCGSKGNLTGDEWAISVAREALANGKSPQSHDRATPLNVMGVGKQGQTCFRDCELPVAMSRTRNGKTEVHSGTFRAPVIPNSSVPGLLGLGSLIKNRAILDLNTMQLHFCGSGNARIILPANSDSFQLELSPSGHLMLPCCEFNKAKH